MVSTDISVIKDFSYKRLKYYKNKYCMGKMTYCK